MFLHIPDQLKQVAVHFTFTVPNSIAKINVICMLPFYFLFQYLWCRLDPTKARLQISTRRHARATYQKNDHIISLSILEYFIFSPHFGSHSATNRWNRSKINWPVNSVLADESARSNAVLPSVLRIWRLAPFWSKTVIKSWKLDTC